MSTTQMPYSDYQIALLQAQRAQNLANALRQQSFEPIESYESGVLKSPISWTQGLAKMLQAYAANKGEERSMQNLAKASNLQNQMYQGIFGAPSGGGFSMTTGAPMQMAQNPPSPSPEQYGQNIIESALTGQPNAPQVTQPQIVRFQPTGQPGLRVPMGQTPQSMASMMQTNPQLASSLVGEYNKPDPTTLAAMNAGYTPEQIQDIQSRTLEKGAYIAPLNTRPGSVPADPYTGMPLPSSEALIQAQARSAAVRSAAEAYGKAPYELSIVQTSPAPRLMTKKQQIEMATRRPMPLPGFAPQTQIRPQPPGSPQMQNVIPGGNVIQALNPEGVPGLRLQDQGEAAEQTKTGQLMAEYTGSVMQDAAKAGIANRMLDNMVLSAQDFTPGKLAPMHSSLIQWAQATGIPVSESDKRQSGSIQALTSMAIKMAGTATRQSDAQPSQRQYMTILESMPNEQRTIDGFNKIAAYLRDMNNYSIEKYKHLQDWRNTHNGSAEGFESEWPSMERQIPFVWNTQGLGKGGKTNAPPTAIQHLRTNNTPEMRKAFQDKYGYLPF